jgi:hypothetical protein
MGNVLREWTVGRRLAVLAAIFQRSPAVILVARRADISNVSELRGRTLMDTPGSDEIAAMLKREGVDYAALPRVAHEGNPRDLLAGRADAMVAYSTNEPFVALARNGLQCIKVAHRADGLTQNTVPLKEQKTCGSADLGTIAASARQSSRRDNLMDRLYDIEHRVQTARVLATIRSRLRGRYRAPTLQGVRSRLAGWRRFPECAGR